MKKTATNGTTVNRTGARAPFVYDPPRRGAANPSTDEDGTTPGSFALAADIGVPLLGSVPIEPAVGEGGDIGEPATLGNTPAAEVLREIAQAIAEEHIPPVEMAGCSARMLDAAVAALDELDLDDSVA